MQKGIAVRPEVHIDSGIQSHDSGLLLVPCDAVVSTKPVNAHKVRNHKAIKSPFVLQDSAQKFRIRRARHPVNGIV